ncbi:polymer-forming cytoskeletal protein [Radiobacillus kanasensis]|uniref:polymer-forming cytoskeletal protein n=1 Tax=Radiobacillus kanasensis TaxID=2844358 RepID=UPI001E2A3C83|nr:polymer-forming cytoskeletal protein [Radiobacillus kanasensis]UFT99688.1 polymer-forming cytoskeletal protein [Radiobacillus kanasensis]
MISNQMRELKISGSGSTSGGTYGYVKINGNGTVYGDLTCQEFVTGGSSKVEGDLTSELIVIKGKTNVDGSVQAEIMEVQGTCKVAGSTSFRELVVKGSTKVAGSLSGDELLLKGTLKVNGDCDVTLAKMQGCFTVYGALKTEHASIKLHGKCSATSIYAKRLEVIKGGLSFGLENLFEGFAKELRTDTIVAETVYLEHTRANIVKGKNVYIGPECHIDYVEYTDEITISPDAVVKEKKQV